MLRRAPFPSGAPKAQPSFPGSSQVFPVGEIEVNQAAGQQDTTYQNAEQQHVFAEQPTTLIHTREQRVRNWCHFRRRCLTYLVCHIHAVSHIAKCTTFAAISDSSGHLITSLARNSRDRGMVIPWAFAVLRLSTSSKSVGCSIGNSCGCEPRKILSTYPAARLYVSVRLDP